MNEKIEWIGEAKNKFIAYTQSGYFFKDTNSHAIEVNTQSELNSIVRSVSKCNCYECR